MTKYSYDLFISYSSRDTSDAEKIKSIFEANGFKVFLASEELMSGMKWPESIIEALSNSWEACVLFTKDSLEREWVISEWTVALFLNKVVTPILKGVKVHEIPERLRAIQFADFSKANLFLKSFTERKFQQKDNYNDFIECCALKSEKKIQQTLFSLDTSGSPLNFIRCLELASKSVFFCGQNYYWPLVSNESICREALFSFFKGNNEEIRFMLCDYECESAVATWCIVNGNEYKKHLKDATKNLCKWVNDAEKNKLNIVAKAVPFVPVSATFLDFHNPESCQARLILTPNIFESMSGRRPSIRFSRVNHQDIYDNYYEPYNTLFSQGRDIRNINIP